MYKLKGIKIEETIRSTNEFVFQSHEKRAILIIFF